MIYKFNGRRVTHPVACAGVVLFLLAYFAIVLAVFATVGYVCYEVLFGGLLG